MARAAVEGYEVIDAYSRPVRLGEGVALNGSLCGDAIERTLQALAVCAARLLVREPDFAAAINRGTPLDRPTPQMLRESAGAGATCRQQPGAGIP